MKIRMEGTAEECQQAAPRLAEVFEVVSVSDPYPNRGRSRLIRVYVEARLDPERTPPGTTESPRQRGTLYRADRELSGP